MGVDASVIIKITGTVRPSVNKIAVDVAVLRRASSFASKKYNA